MLRFSKWKGFFSSHITVGGLWGRSFNAPIRRGRHRALCGHGRWGAGGWGGCFVRHFGESKVLPKSKHPQGQIQEMKQTATTIKHETVMTTRPVSRGTDACDLGTTLSPWIRMNPRAGCPPPPTPALPTLIRRSLGGCFVAGKRTWSLNSF